MWDVLLCRLSVEMYRTHAQCALAKNNSGQILLVRSSVVYIWITKSPQMIVGQVTESAQDCACAV